MITPQRTAGELDIKIQGSGVHSRMGGPSSKDDDGERPRPFDSWLSLRFNSEI